jgi:predicted aldo/keto reductase-like oxidoreductase
MGDNQHHVDGTRREFLQTASAGTAAVVASHALTLGAAEEQPLPQRDFGKTGVQVPIIGVGTAPAGQRPRQEAARFYADCLDAGVNYLDTAPEFAGYGVAQAAVGDVLKTRRKEAFVVTKCWEPDGEKALKLLRDNLKELQTDHADLVYAHSIGSDKMDPRTVGGPQGVMKALQKAQRDGLTRFIGVSGHNRPERFLDIMKDFELQAMMTAVSYVARHIYDFEEKVWPEAQRRGIALVAMKVYGGGSKPRGGRITGADVFDAFRYAQSLPQISTVVVGMYDDRELAENIRFAKTYKPLNKQELEDLTARGKRQSDDWGTPYGAVN